MIITIVVFYKIAIDQKNFLRSCREKIRVTDSKTDYKYLFYQAGKQIGRDGR